MAYASVDNGSGFKLIYTPTLRPNDIGTLMIGATNIAIPGNIPSVQLAGQCPSGCTAKFPNALNVLSSGIHMHQLGQSAYTQQIRNGVELPRITDLPFYDFKFQSGVSLKNGTTILPGDLLIHHCIWDSIGKTQITTYGESTSNEMCYSFIVYYPKILIDQCFSANTSIGTFNVNSLCRNSHLQVSITDVVSYDTGKYVALPPKITTCAISSSGSNGSGSNGSGGVSQTTVVHANAGKLEVLLVLFIGCVMTLIM